MQVARGHIHNSSRLLIQPWERTFFKPCPRVLILLGNLMTFSISHTHNMVISKSFTNNLLLLSQLTWNLSGTSAFLISLSLLVNIPFSSSLGSNTYEDKMANWHSCFAFVHRYSVRRFKCSQNIASLNVLMMLTIFWMNNNCYKKLLLSLSKMYTVKRWVSYNNYYSFKIFHQFWLAPILWIILHNQLVLTKFGRCEQYTIDLMGSCIITYQ